MQFLFQPGELDVYEFVSAGIHTDMFYTLDGRINHDFFQAEELEELELTGQNHLSWRMARERVFSLIKGKKTPSQLKIVLKASPAQLSALLASSHSPLHPNDVDGLFLNLHYQNNKLQIVCGVSYHVFTLDKTLELEFSNRIITLFKSKGITCDFC
jgi:hypothetical protein